MKKETPDRMRKIRHIWQWFLSRSVIIISVLIVTVAVLFVWLIAISFSQPASVVSIGIAAVSALFAAISSFAALLQAVEVQKQRKSQERPYVLAYFDGGSSGVIYFVIQNFGNSPAIDVTVEFDPPPIDFANRPLNQVSPFANPVSFLPPGKSLRQIIDVGRRFFADDKPTKFQVSLIYSSIYHELYQESAGYDLTYLKEATVARKTTEENLEAITEELKKLVKQLNKVSTQKSLLVEKPDEYLRRVQREIDRNDNLPNWKLWLRSTLMSILSKLE